MTTYKPPKPTKLGKTETLASFESWKHNQLYNLYADPSFKAFLANTTTWGKKGPTANRGLTDDPTDAENRQTAAGKCNTLNLLLDQIANYCPYISRSFIVKQSTSLHDVWQTIREHYGFLSTGGHFLDLSNVKMEADERPEDLYQRIYMFFEDNLLSANSLSHNGDRLASDEEMTPTLENTITWLWLHLLHPGLPLLVKQKYGADLRNKTLASLKTEVSQAMSSLLEELSSLEEAKVFRTGQSYHGRFQNKQKTVNKPSKRSCVLCKSAGRTYNSHWLSQCTFLPEEDRKALSRATECDDNQEDTESRDDAVEGGAFVDVVHTCRRVGNIPSPVLEVAHGSGTLHITVDSGCTANMIRESVARAQGLKIHPATQTAGQADGVTRLDTIGEVHFTVSRNGYDLIFDGLVVRTLSDDVLGGMPFMALNDIGVRPAKSMIIIAGTECIPFNAKGVCTPMVRRSDLSLVLKAPKCRSVVLPGESLKLSTPSDVEPNLLWALEPRCDNSSPAWFQPQEVVDRDHEIEVKNNSNEPILIGKHAHVCQARSVSEISSPLSSEETTPVVQSLSVTKKKVSPFSELVSVNPDGLVSPEITRKVKDINRMYDQVFCPELPKYNGKSGGIQCHINMGPVKPPQRKARLPQYDNQKMVLLQEKFDDLERQGVLRKPEEIGVTVEYLNMSFLVTKTTSSTDFRLVTAFAEIGKYSKPQPSLMPNVEETLRTIGRWKFIIKTDLKQAYYQIPLSKESKKYAGTASPFKGVRVYDRAAMGLPGSETALEELMNRVLGDLIMKGCVAKVADDCYCGSDTVEGSIYVYEQLLAAFAANNLGLNAVKTIIFPKRTVILGWIWEMGTLSASPHRIVALSAIEPPTTVKALRSFIGAYKYIGKVIRWHSNYVNPLDQLVAGRESKERVQWSDENLQHFRKAQESLKTCIPIHIAKPSDQIWIQTDGSLRPEASTLGGIAATLFLIRDGKVLIGGFFNAQIKKNQCLWLPCEVEALAIASAISYFSPIISQSSLRAKVATDSEACVQAYKRMERGLFSTSARVMTFLTAICRYGVEVNHIAGVDIPFTDYASRHPIACEDRCCQVCKFMDEISEEVVRKLSVRDVMEGQIKMPFTNRQAWMESQKQCQDLRKVHALLSLGKKPGIKETKIRDVKSYMQKVVIARDGLLVVRDITPLQLDRERIVVPQSFILGLLTALHLRFEHPTAHQLKMVVKRYFYAINIDKLIFSVTDTCDQCNSLKFVPEGLCEQTTSSPPASVGCSFAFDVMNREKQKIAVLRETVTSFTVSTFVKSENHIDLRNSLIILSVGLKGFSAEIRVDPAPGLACLVNDERLKAKGIVLTPGQVKNRNKNPVAERAIQELEHELVRLQPDKGAITEVTLAEATANVNSRVRRDGLSSRELWTQRDQVTGAQLPFDDEIVIDNQYSARQRNHHFSSKSKARGKEANLPSVKIGSLVYLASERSKSHARNKYMVTNLVGNSCVIQKFVRNQFRKKRYTVPLTSVFPIIGKESPLISRDNSDSSSSDSDTYIQVHVPIHEDIQVTEEEVCGANNDNNEVIMINDIMTTQRPQRNRRPPVRYKDYIMEDLE